MSDRFAEVLATVEREHDARSHPDAPRPSQHVAARARPRHGLDGREDRRAAAAVATARPQPRSGRSSPSASSRTGPSRSSAATCRRDFDRHRWWLVVDVLGGLVGLALTPIPGPQPARLLLHVPHRRPLLRASRRAPRTDRGAMGPGAERRRSRSWRRSTGWRRASGCVASKRSPSGSACPGSRGSTTGPPQGARDILAGRKTGGTKRA